MQQGRAFLGAVLLSEYEQQTEQFAAGLAVAYVRSAGGVERGLWLSNETEFELMLRTAGGERRLAAISTQPLVYADRFKK